jgi:hypothetical protein
MSEFKSNVVVKMGSTKSFGIWFSFIFLMIGLYPLLTGVQVRVWSLVVALILLVLAYLAPRILSVPNILWFKLGMMLGAIGAPFVMAIIYFFVVAPIGMIIRLAGKDLLSQKLDKTANSYWIKREEQMGSMRDQF